MSDPAASGHSKRQLALATLAIHGGQSPDPSTGAVMPPIYATSTYAQSSPGEHQGFEYSRTHNPTRFAYERCVASLEGGTRGYAFASGMAATSTVMELLDAGSHVVAMDDIYGGTFRLFERVRARSAGHRFSFVDLTDPARLREALTPETTWALASSSSSVVEIAARPEAKAKAAEPPSRSATQRSSAQRVGLCERP